MTLGPNTGPGRRSHPNVPFPFSWVGFIVLYEKNVLLGYISFLVAPHSLPSFPHPPNKKINKEKRKGAGKGEERKRGKAKKPL